MRPHPSPQDIAAAEALYEAFADRFHRVHDRADYVAALARAEMQKRLEAEFRAAVAQSAQHDRQCLAAVASLAGIRAGLAA